mmetsp:Transcript_76232/g.143653  ORF Transcript_76232/g.143653 Transcript_76232/m.143653 type:complete len:389 (+) Transcript_76232:62-1228(+)
MHGNTSFFTAFLASISLGLHVAAVPAPTLMWANQHRTALNVEAPHVLGFTQLMQTAHHGAKAKRISIDKQPEVAAAASPSMALSPAAAGARPVEEQPTVYQHYVSEKQRIRAEKKAAAIVGKASHGKVMLLISLPILATLGLLYLLLQDLKRKQEFEAKIKARRMKQQQWIEDAQVAQCSINETCKPSASSTASDDRSEYSDALCAAHVVRHPDGLTLAVGGLIAPRCQEEALEVLKVNQKNEVTMRILLSEGGEDSGILIESADNLPIGFLNTSLAINAAGQESRDGSREVTICRASPGCSPFAVVQADPFRPEHYIVRRGSRNGPLVHSIRLASPDRKVVNAEGVLTALLDARISKDGCQQLSLQINPDVDASLVLCSVLAAIKLM